MSRQQPVLEPAPKGAGPEFVFLSDTTNGALQDPTNNRIVFLISTPTNFFSKAITTVTLPDGTGVASINWGSLFQSRTVTFRGQTRPRSDVLVRKRKPGKLTWVDNLDSDTYTWRNGLIYSPQEQVVGRYTRGKKHLIRDNEPATLQVNNTHLHLIDRFLIAAIIIGHAKRQSRRSHRGAGGGGVDRLS